MICLAFALGCREEEGVRTRQAYVGTVCLVGNSSSQAVTGWFRSRHEEPSVQGRGRGNTSCERAQKCDYARGESVLALRGASLFHPNVKRVFKKVLRTAGAGVGCSIRKHQSAVPADRGREQRFVQTGCFRARAGEREAQGITACGVLPLSRLRIIAHSMPELQLRFRQDTNKSGG
jgi:hypothetical protein